VSAPAVHGHVPQPLPSQRLTVAADLAGASISEGFAARAPARAATVLAPFTDRLETPLQDEQLVTLKDTSRRLTVRA
jgi:hypothetical protein